MFCGKCGSPNADHSAFCANCGAAMKAAPVAAPAMTDADRKRYRLVGMVATGIAALLVIALLFSIFAGNGVSSPEKVGKKFMNALLDADAEDIFDLAHDKEINYLRKEANLSKREFKEKIEDASDSLEDSLDNMDGYKLSYKIDSVEDPSDTMIDRIETYYKDNCDLKVKDIKKIAIKFTAKKGDNSNTTTMNIYAVKIGGAWYLPIESVSFVF